MIPLHITPNEITIAVLAVAGISSVLGYTLYEIFHSRSTEIEPEVYTDG